MAGNREGGLKAARRNLENNQNFYREIGSKGGSKSSTGGFAYKELCECPRYLEAHKKAQCAGFLGGKISRRGKSRVSMRHVA